MPFFKSYFILVELKVKDGGSVEKGSTIERKSGV